MNQQDSSSLDINTLHNHHHHHYHHHLMWNSSPSLAKSSEWSHQNSQEREEKTRYPDNFTPSPYTVLIGGGKACAEALGNKRLKVIVSTYLDKYSNAPNQISCSIIVSKVVDIFHEVRSVGWWEVSDLVAHVRVGSILQDLLHEHKSSSKSKLARQQSSTMDTKEGQQLMMNNQQAMQPPPPPPLNPTPVPALSSGDVYKGTSNKNMLGLGGYDTARRSSATDEKNVDQN
jgi:hypothetical protein